LRNNAPFGSAVLLIAPHQNGARVMASVFMVTYTIAAGLIAAVSQPIKTMDRCEEVAKHYTDNKAWRDQEYQEPVEYFFECEEHNRRPKVEAKIDPSDRHYFESTRCVGLATQCEQLPNGNVAILTSARDKHGRRIILIIKGKDLEG
jgi:hypothetical protein